MPSRSPPSFGAKGMTWMKVAERTASVQHRPVLQRERSWRRLRARFRGHGRGRSHHDCRHLAGPGEPGALRPSDSTWRKGWDLIPRRRLRALWVTDFPLFETQGGRTRFPAPPLHHAGPHRLRPRRTRTNCSPSSSRAYDLVMNGEELGGGSIRIHRMDIQRKIFQALELSG